MNNPFEDIYSNIIKLTQQVDMILQKLGEVGLHDEFNIKTQKNAAKILSVSVKTLQNKIKEGKLKNNYHYRATVSTKNRKCYFFSEVALKSDKGLI